MEQVKRKVAEKLFCMGKTIFFSSLMLLKTVGLLVVEIPYCKNESHYFYGLPEGNLL